MTRKLRRLSVALTAAAALVAAGCASDEGGAAPAGGDARASGDARAQASDGRAARADGGADRGPAADAIRGPAPRAPRAYSKGRCPALKPGVFTGFASGKKTRRFELYLPAKPKGAPLLFVWHGLGDSAANMARAFGAAGIARNRGAVVVVPDAQRSPPLLTGWNYAGDGGDDLVLFDDLLACIDAQYDIDNRRVYTTGFSAGALFSTFIIMNRGDQIAAAVLFSGGALFGYKKPAYRMPVVVAWGGPRDLFGGGLVNFDTLAKNLIRDLSRDGHLVVSCDHGLGHRIPFGAGAWAYPFLFDHRYGVSPSPYAKRGLGSSWPAYCKIASKGR